tara:strand:- start:3194 stop:4048 length:855 start_codon:yes stop_codon:yes gene_type:complete
MRPLIDGDILLHELGWSGQFKDKDTGEEVLLPFDTVQALLDEKIRLICEDVGATEPPTLYLTNSVWLTKHLNKSQRYQDTPPCEFIENFRYKVAITKPYKGTRNNPKPYHFYNITTYLLAEYNCIVSRGGLEADDMMTLEQSRSDDTIICSRDKDLRMCEGWHFSWECGKQRSVGPHYTDRLGSLGIGNNDKTLGYGLKMFFYQMLVGDTADNIPGLPKVGDVRAFKLLQDLSTEEEMFRAVQSLYKEKIGDGAREYFTEQMLLLWMKQEGADVYRFRKSVDEE